MPDQHASTPRTADPLGGRYRLHAAIARGGMATVYRATDEVLERAVAVKVLHPHLADDPAFLERFRREARAAAALSHPNLVAVYDWGETGDSAFLVMELVEGMSLRDALRIRGRLTPGEALALLGPAARGVAAVHAAGLVHRDIKPENVLVAASGALKVTDFGLARAAAATTHTFGADTLVGSPHYLAPEVVEGEPAGPRADVYALGIMLYECLVGRPPFEGETPVATALAHTQHDVPAPSAAVPDLSPALDAVVRRATAADPAARYTDASEFVAALEGAVPEGPAPVDLRDGSTDTVVLPAVTADTVVRPARRRRRRWRRAVLLALLTAAVLGTAGYAVWALVLAPLQPIPDVRGDEPGAARAVLEEAGFAVAIAAERPHSLEVAAGLVLATDPGERARRGDTVALVLSAGPRQVAVPRVAGQEEAAARQAIEGAGLVVDPESVFHETVAEGQAVGTDPPEGTALDEGSTVVLLVSKGPEPIAVPDLFAMTEAAALELLDERGLAGRVAAREHNRRIPAGQVLRQDPQPSEIVHRGDTVAFVVSLGPETVPMPDVTGEREGDAVRILEGLDLEVTVIYRDTIFGFRKGQVAEQDPQAGRPVARGDEVVIWVWR